MPSLAEIKVVATDALPPDDWFLLPATFPEKLTIVEYPDGSRVLEYEGCGIMYMEVMPNA